MGRQGSFSTPFTQPEFIGSNEKGNPRVAHFIARFAQLGENKPVWQQLFILFFRRTGLRLVFQYASRLDDSRLGYIDKEIQQPIQQYWKENANRGSLDNRTASLFKIDTFFCVYPFARRRAFNRPIILFFHFIFPFSWKDEKDPDWQSSCVKEH